jgi:hypothetical protein
MLRLSQRDKKWASEKIGKSKSTLGGNGCLITSLCMVLSKFYPERGFTHYYTPLEAARDWKYVAVAGDSDPKYLAWTSINNSGMKFVWRNYGYQPDRLIEDPITKESDIEFNVLKKYMKHPDYGVVLQVINSKGNQHWLAGVGKAVLNWAANDPWYGIRLWFAPLPYRKIAGWALIKKD